MTTFTWGLFWTIAIAFFWRFQSRGWPRMWLWPIRKVVSSAICAAWSVRRSRLHTNEKTKNNNILHHAPGYFELYSLTQYAWFNFHKSRYTAKITCTLLYLLFSHSNHVYNDVYIVPRWWMHISHENFWILRCGWYLISNQKFEYFSGFYSKYRLKWSKRKLTVRDDPVWLQAVSRKWYD